MSCLRVSVIYRNEYKFFLVELTLMKLAMFSTRRSFQTSELSSKDPKLRYSSGICYVRKLGSAKKL